MPATGDLFDPTLIVFAALAVFVIWKLRSVLGMRVDRDTPPARFAPRPAAPAAVAPVQSAAPVAAAARPSGAERWEGVAEKGVASAWSGLDAIAASDPSFDGKAFLSGARRAYELIVTAFAKGDRETLKPLLSQDVFDGFSAEIARREQQGETMETAVVAIDSSTVDAARAIAGRNEVTVRFVARLMSERRDRAGETIDGGQTRRVIERWTFARDPKAGDPNWKLVATQAED
ncbi:MAG: Tim44 domain-containing protein [Alphaproteobacteria bacterium]|nr:Tim44 domain-containing protein [Alphaproteobacteria bacterium]MBM3652904.1 Tim44 domain-containing protein [Alphaproteobacteria bacterium]